MRWALITALAIWADGAAAEGCTALGAFLAGRAADLPDAICRDSVTETGPGRACFWAYPYRSSAGYSAYGAQIAALEACVPAAVAQPRPQGVNHPDTHDVRLYQVDEDRVTISLKDKAQRGQSLVFVIVDFGGAP